MKYFPGLFLFLLFCSCSSYRYPSLPPQEVSEVNYFAPYAYVQLIQKGNRAELNDSLSALTRQLLESTLIRQRTPLRLDERIDLSTDSLTDVRIAGEVAYLVHSIQYGKPRTEPLPLTPAIDSLLDARQQRFAQVVVATGFGRRKGNYGGQIAKGAAIGILTLGMYAPVPVKSSLALYTLVFDGERNEVAYFARTQAVEKDPTDPAVIARQLRSLYADYLYPTYR